MRATNQEGWYKPARCRIAHYFRPNKRVMYPANSHESLCPRRLYLRDYGGTPADLKADRNDLGDVGVCVACLLCKVKC